MPVLSWFGRYNLLLAFLFASNINCSQAQEYDYSDSLTQLNEQLNQQPEFRIKPDAEKPLNKAEMDEAFDQFSASLGISETSRLYRPFRRFWIMEAGKPDTEKENSKQLARSSGPLTTDKSLLSFDKNLPILVHYKGQLGEEIPAKDQVWNPGSLLPREELRQKLEELEPEIRKVQQSLVTAPQIERCVESKTERSKLPNSRDIPKDKQKQLMVDLLFINKGDLPSEPEEAFGRKVILRKYQANSLDPLSLYISKIGTKCLPYRVRATRTTKMEDYGLNALLNYEDDPTGKGKLSPLMEKKILDMGYVFRGK